MDVSWPLVFTFIRTHPSECGRPRYVRAVLLYGSFCYRVQAVCTWLGVPSFIIWRLIGVRVLMCVTCQELAFASVFGSLVMNAWIKLKYLMIPGHDGIEQLYYDESDVDRFTEDEISNLDITLEDKQN